jgi:hypothetical protein
MMETILKVWIMLKENVDLYRLLVKVKNKNKNQKSIDVI